MEVTPTGSRSRELGMWIFGSLAMACMAFVMWLKFAKATTDFGPVPTITLYVLPFIAAIWFTRERGFFWRLAVTLVLVTALVMIAVGNAIERA